MSNELCLYFELCLFAGISNELSQEEISINDKMKLNIEKTNSSDEYNNCTLHDEWSLLGVSFGITEFIISNKNQQYMS